jgi:diaminopimelate epimerase
VKGAAEHPVKKILFTKMHGAGNDFIVIDNRDKQYKTAAGFYSDLAKRLCKHKFSVGGDGLLVLEPSQTQDFKMLIFNSDGSQAEMCGNGARCIAYYAYMAKCFDKNAPEMSNKLSFETLAGIIQAYIFSSKNVSTGKVRLHLTDPQNLKLNFPLKVGQREFDVSYVNTGVPHTVVFVSPLSKVDVQTLGNTIRNHRQFLPEGTNVNFVEKDKQSADTLHVRTYERGVEQETFACGTGATASAIIAGLNKMVRSPVKVITSGNEILTVYFRVAEGANLLNPVYDVHLEGQVHISFTGEVI